MFCTPSFYFSLYLYSTSKQHIMKEKGTRYNCRVFIDKDSQIMIRVRWNNKKNEVGFSIGCFANPEKWDGENQRAKYNTTHRLGSKMIVTRDINNRINGFLSTIESCFIEANLYKKTLTPPALKEYVNASLGRIKIEKPEVEVKLKSLAEYFAEFMEVMPIEKNWNSVTHHKYNQMWNQVNSAIPNLKLEDIDKNMMNKLKQWYITNQYNNRTTSRQIRFFKGLLNWIDINGYHIKKEALKYKVNLTLNEKTITFLTSKELRHCDVLYWSC